MKKIIISFFYTLFTFLMLISLYDTQKCSGFRVCREGPDPTEGKIIILWFSTLFIILLIFLIKLIRKHSRKNNA